ncbi:MAG: hypothetical protein WC683_07350 [bacterium]|jgi:hypothetical protein
MKPMVFPIVVRYAPAEDEDRDYLAQQKQLNIAVRGFDIDEAMRRAVQEVQSVLTVQFDYPGDVEITPIWMGARADALVAPRPVNKTLADFVKAPAKDEKGA